MAMVAFENLILELFGFLLPGFIAYAATMHFAIGPLYPSLDKSQNQLYFCLIASSIYLIARAYFGLVYYFASELPWRFQMLTDTYFKPVLITAGFLVPFGFPFVRSLFWSLYEANLGELFSVLYTACEPEINKAYLFGIRIGGLVVGWFALLFVLELVLRLVLIVIRAIYGGIITLIFGRKSKEMAEIINFVDEKIKSE